MKHLKLFNIFEEVNFRDLGFIEKNFDDYFTISFEFEIETKDELGLKLKFDDFDDELADDIETVVCKDFTIRKKSEKELVQQYVYDVLDLVEFGEANLETYNKLFDTNKLKSEREKEIVSHIKNSISSVVIDEDYTYLKRKVKEFLPNFYKKWFRKIDFVGDATLDRGIEIKPKTYNKSISESIEMINDFYSDLDNQHYWIFSERTGLHINIGVKKTIKWNPIKGFILLNDFSKEEKTPFVFKDMTWRLNIKYCGSLTPYLFKLEESEKEKIKSLDIHNLSETENFLNELLVSKVKDIGFKNLGFNITKLDQNYVEFRYAGGEIPKEVLIEKVKYFCFVVYSMTNPEYKKSEYLKKLYKFIDSL